jgi:redox-sensitive bicupin YhaK (pirin superfamily)
VTIVPYPSNQRGFADHGWLKSFHTFNFGEYFDPTRKRFGLLRVFNQDRVAPLKGFETHGHANMEIISIPISGKLHHKDSNGSDFFLEAGDIQVMSAGSGIQHSEFNASSTEETHFLQIWVFPNKENTEPNYQQKKFKHFENKNTWELIVSPDGRNHSLKILQDAFFQLGTFNKNQKISYKLNSTKNGVFVFCLEGEIDVSEQKIQTGDALGISEAETIGIDCAQDSKILLIEVPLKPF